MGNIWVRRRVTHVCHVQVTNVSKLSSSLWTTAQAHLNWTIQQCHITPGVPSRHGLKQVSLHLLFKPIVQISYACALADACMIAFWSGKVCTENSSLLWIFHLHQLKIDSLVHKHGRRISIALARGLQPGPGPLGISSHGWFKSLLPACLWKG